MTLGGVADGATHFVARGLRQVGSDTIADQWLAWFGRAPTLPCQTLDTAWAEPPAQRANRKRQQ
jgi:hypothetical protein